MTASEALITVCGGEEAEEKARTLVLRELGRFHSQVFISNGRQKQPSITCVIPHSIQQVSLVRKKEINWEIPSPIQGFFNQLNEHDLILIIKKIPFYQS